MSGLLDKFMDFKVESLFATHKVAGPARTVFVNEALPEAYLDHRGRPKKEHVYSVNQVITSKYSIITFLPRNLLEQFRRVANIFFLVIAILQFFSEFSTISPGVVILPVLAIWAITALKDGYEDIGRHQSDRTVNYSTIHVLSGGEYANHNAMEKKTKTFVRGLTTRRHSKKKLENNPYASDIEMVISPTLAPKVSSASSNDTEVASNNSGSKPDIPTADDSTGDHPSWQKTLWEDVRVGDFVKIMDHESLPADVLICATSEEDNVAFVETKNLDGETNLKSRNAVVGLTHLRTAVQCANKSNAFHVDCDRPDLNMYRLNATVVVGDERYPVSIENTLLRGTTLRNTSWVIGVVLFTGVNSKIVLNSGETPSKRTRVERQMNPMVLFNLLMLVCMAIVCATVDSVLESRHFRFRAPWSADVYDKKTSGLNGIITFVWSFLVFQNVVPISLYISVEVVRTIQAAFIFFDKDIWYEKTNQAALARSWNLSDDLGQIEYIFSDKTGTLTQNSMIFRECSIGGRVYSGDSIADSDSTHSASSVHFQDATLKQDLDASGSAEPNTEEASHARTLNGFFAVLALCHTVLTSVDSTTGEISYKAQSPDEEALVQAAADVGFVFKGRERETLTLKTPFSEDDEKYELMNILEFTSARKRMSVVLRKVEPEDGRLFLLSKGADNVIFERLKSGGDELKQITEDHLDDFARGGLRTLTLAYKVVPEEEYAAWSERYHEAVVSMEDREEKIDLISDELEQDLRLLGATAIEDRLQDGVPEAIADLKLAGIKIWVATGDKLETAIAIGHSTNLIGKDSNIIIIRGGHSRTISTQIDNALTEYFPDHDATTALTADSVRKMQSTRNEMKEGNDGYALDRVNTSTSSIVGHGNGERPGGFVLVIDGPGLAEALSDANKDMLLHLATLCEGVICCRVSPMQKALVVKLVKDGLGVMTLAIGDGANDVSMIQAADVGVGISGEEGLQAVNSSDYAIGQFRFLTRLLLVHGHWSYYRNGTMILNFFYKNMVPTGVLFWFQIYCAWSANYVFDYPYLLLWNSVWTIAPVVGLGLFDRLIDDKVLMAIPELYRYGREGHWFKVQTFLLLLLDGVYQSTVIYFIILYGYFSPSSREDGFGVYLYEFSTTMAISAVLVANLYVGMNTNAWTLWVVFAVFIGTVINWIYTAIYSASSVDAFVYGNDLFLFQSANFWLCLFITIVVALTPRYIYKVWLSSFAGDDLETIRWMSKSNPSMDLSSVRMGSKLAALQRPPSVISRGGSRPASIASTVPPRASVDTRPQSRVDMATGMRSVHRGFDFAMEEGGVAMARMQTNMSERRQSNRSLPNHSPSKKTSKLSHVFSVKKRLKRKTNTPLTSPKPGDS